MSVPVLCQVRRAETPYYIEEVDLHIYSLEELCWFCVHNLPLLDEAFFGRDLQDWIKYELRLRRLALVLADLQKKEDFLLEQALLPILREIHFLDGSGEKALLQELRDMDALPLPMKKKRKADTLSGHQKYLKAIQEYRSVLAMQNSASMGAQFTGMVYNNMGVAYAKLFEMEEAVMCMQKAYDLLHSRKALFHYLFCVWLGQGEESFRKCADQLGVDTQTRRQIKEEIDSVKPQARPADLQDALGQWVKEYHRETGM